MASVNIEVKCLACGKPLNKEEQSGDFCKNCMYEYTNNWVSKLWQRKIY